MRRFPPDAHIVVDNVVGKPIAGRPMSDVPWHPDSR